MGTRSDFKQAAQNQLTCSYTNPCTSKTCLWLQPTEEHACSNLTAGSALVWKRVTPGLFRTELSFRASQASAGKYDFMLHLPLKAKGKNAASEYNSIPVKVNVMARTCASNSAICFENKDSPGPCSSLSDGISYTNGDRLQVQVSRILRTLMGSGSLRRQLTLLLPWSSHSAHPLCSLGATRTP